MLTSSTLLSPLTLLQPYSWRRSGTPWLYHRAGIVRLEYGDGESVRYTPHRTARLHMEFSVWSAGWSACLRCLLSPYVMLTMCCQACDCSNDVRCFVSWCYPSCRDLYSDGLRSLDAIFVAGLLVQAHVIHVASDSDAIRQRLFLYELFHIICPLPLQLGAFYPSRIARVLQETASNSYVIYHPRTVRPVHSPFN